MWPFTRKPSTVFSILERLKHMSQQLDDLTAQVTANTDVVNSALTLIKGLAAALEAAGTDPAKLDALKASLKASDDALAAAVAANTPAAPPAP